ncbi:hypothetical protein [Oceanobacillus kimchii]|uniref:hypothetical protein n=1 Tax=Oceanobacillus kimchii TaxID=746691 RepID=UPI00232E1F0C|nr:hypothetical protein [Oceanobacillus kimchii]
MRTNIRTIEMIDNEYKDTIIMLENKEFGITPKMLKKITKLNNEGYCYKKISDMVERDPIEVIIALLHQADTKRITLGDIRGL